MPVEIVQEKNAWPLRVRAPKPSPHGGVRTIRVGLLGLGHVGQAVARLAADRGATARAGIRFQIEQALVRNGGKARNCPTPGRMTTDPSAFLQGTYDVVIEALDAVEPARTLVAQVLAGGTSVVTANKALVAEHGGDLEAIASAHGVSLRFEATALSAVPFLGTLADRPFVAAVDRVVAIVNGTSNYLLSSMADPPHDPQSASRGPRDGVTSDAALGRAQELGFAEPDPSRDVDGLDAADKLLLLTSLFGWGRLSRESLEVRGIRGITPDDLAAARAAGGTIKPLVFAHRDSGGVRAFVGPAYIAASEPLAALTGSLNGIRLDGRYVSNLFFSGPGAGPDVTAATLLDDAVQAVSVEKRRIDRAAPASKPVFAASPATPWFVRVTFPGVVPAANPLAALARSAGLHVERVCDHASQHSRWLLLGAQGRRDLDAALATLESTNRIQSAAYRRI